MSFKDHFSRLAAQYSAFRPAYPPAIFDYLAQLCRDRQIAWDCACGTGQATLALAERFQAVIATDASAQQVAAAPAHPNVTYRAARAEESGIESQSVDLVTVAQALHWFDLDPFYGEVQRVLKPSGVLAVWTYGPLQVDGCDACVARVPMGGHTGLARSRDCVAQCEIDALFQEFYWSIVGPYWPPERRFVEEGYRGLTFPFAEIAPPAFNMEVHWERAHLLGYLRTWSATARYVEATGVDPVEVLEERLTPVWADAHSTRKVTWPLALRVGYKP